MVEGRHRASRGLDTHMSRPVPVWFVRVNEIVRAIKGRFRADMNENAVRTRTQQWFSVAMNETSSDSQRAVRQPGAEIVFLGVTENVA